MNRLLRRASLRFFLRHPWQLALAIVGVSLGVAVYVGVALANDSAARAFELSSAAVRGATTHRLLPIGGALEESVYVDLVVRRGIPTAAPVVTADVVIAGRQGLRYPLLGIDPLQETGLRGFSSFAPGGSSDLARLITSPATVLLPDTLAARLGVAAGDTVTLLVGGRGQPVEVVGTVPAIGGDVQVEPPIVADIATAQELLGRPGVLSYVDLRLSAEQAGELAAEPPAGTALVALDRAGGAFNELARAFRTNLTALGLLALVVGTFLIYGTMSFAIVQRRATLGMLRAVGVTRAELLGGVLIEALCLAVVATSLGLVLGHVLATQLVELVLRTIGDLYFSASVRAAPPSPSIYAQGGALGLGATLLAAAKPALDAARAAPAAVLRRAELEHRARRGTRIAALAAAPLLAASAVLLLLGSSDLYMAFAALFAVLAAGALLTPAATVLLMRAIEITGRSVLQLPAVLAVRGVSASLSRTGVATAALAVAIATVNGVGLMISSFRASLSDWLETTLTADLYVGFDAEGAALGPADVAAIEAIPGVAGVSLTRSVVLPTDYGELAVRGVRPGPRGWGLEIVSGDAESALAEVAAGRGLVASERFTFARGLSVGDQLVLPTPQGERRLPIVGAFRDFNTGDYSVVMALELYRQAFGDTSLTGIGIHLISDADRATVERAVREALPAPTPFRLRSSETIERLSLEVFDRTFKITEVLRVLAAVVAFLGVLSALLSIELDRARELAVLRALGFAPRQLLATLLTQTGLLGAAAGLAALPLGATLAALLVHVINRRSFGWSMSFVLTPGPLLTGLALAVVASLLAGIYPALRASRVELGGALREE
ncbi:MAG TPA: FtsX-like permease family protein [Gammaproteobacteria bacterium]|nr:FtsX-like permease family protein [Gammaproteobacteria bacterium]